MADWVNQDEHPYLTPREKAILQVNALNVWAKARASAIRKGYDHGYASFVADRAEQRAIRKWEKHWSR